MASDDSQEQKGGANPHITYALLGVIAVLLVAGIAVLLVQNTNQADDISELRTDIEALQGSPEEAAGAAKKLRSLNQTVELLEACVPEIQNQLNSLEVNSGFVSPTDQLSAQCNSLVYPNLQGGGE